MSWVRVLDQVGLPEGAREMVNVAGRNVLLIRHRGSVYAIQANCPHMGLPLELARIDDRQCALYCPWHRIAFDLQTGSVKEWAPWPPGAGPIVGDVRRENALTVFSVKVEDGAIWVHAGA